MISTTDPLGHTTTYQYDCAEPPDRRSTDPLSHTTTTAYDADGNVISTTDPLGQTTTYAYDALNRQTSVTDPLGHTTTTAYDADGNVISATDPLGHTTTYQLRRAEPSDQGDRRPGRRDDHGLRRRRQRDQRDRPRGQHDNLRLRRRQSADQHDRPARPHRDLQYDAAGRMISTTDRDGRSRTFTYDADDRLTTETWYDASNTVVDTLRPSPTTRPATGSRRATTTVSYTYTYDALNRVTTVQEPFGLTLSYTYDAAGNHIERPTRSAARRPTSTTPPIG